MTGGGDRQAVGGQENGSALCAIHNRQVGQHRMKLCPECGIGILIQLASDEEDVCYCPICEEVIHDCVARDEEKPDAV